MPLFGSEALEKCVLLSFSVLPLLCMAGLKEQPTPPPAHFAVGSSGAYRDGWAVVYGADLTDALIWLAL